MLISEITSLPLFLATVRLNGSSYSMPKRRGKSRLWTDCSINTRMRFYEFKNTNLPPKSAPKQRVPSTPIPDQTKRAPIVNWLTRKITRLTNVPHVTLSDVAIAKKRYQRDQKRVNLAYQKARKSRLRCFEE